MLTKFTVSNYAGFEETFIFDLSTNKRYTFNKDLISKKTVKKALVYGPNGSGKSSLCSALMDISYHLVDKTKYRGREQYFLNIGSDMPAAIFCYEFLFDKMKIRYEYSKSDPITLQYEKIYVNDDLKLEYNYFDNSHNIIKFPECSSLNIKGISPKLSIVKYIYSNTILTEKSPISLLINYVNGMLYFKNLTEGNMYIGYTNGAASLSTIIIENNKVNEFQEFLNEQGLNYKLVVTNFSNGDELGIEFKNGKIVPFGSIISSGTKTMWLFYCWMIEFSHLSLLIIDEFDAYYHYSTAQTILKIINNYSNMQSIITTHNITLMNNEITRPDCCYLLDNNLIKPLSSLREKEIRQSNNLQKMYVDGEFSDCLVVKKN